MTPPDIDADLTLALEAIAERLDMQSGEMRTVGIADIARRFGESCWRRGAAARTTAISGVWEAADEAATPVVLHPERARRR